jgi:iron complex outermembrane receptor protein
VAVDPNVPITGPDQSGNRLPKAPKFSVWVGAAYDWSPTSLGTFTARVEYKYQSKIYFDIFEDDFASETDYGLLGARLSFAVADKGWVVSVFGENLTDELYAQSNVRLDGALGNAFFWGAPRTYGFQVAFHF